jgi:hypothetical protein
MHRFSKSSLGGRTSVTLVVVLAALVIVALASGCSTGSYGANPSGGAPVKTGMTVNTASATSTTDPSVQTCGVCGGKGMAKQVAGKAVVKNGVQVVAVQIINGYYVPNKITAKAGMPLQVDFSGKSKGCISKPMFKSLGKKADLGATGAATIDLGSLQPGVYKFSCAMGMGDGSITVQ